MAGDAENYDGRFLSDVGQEILIMPLDPLNEDIPGHVGIDEHQDLMKFIAGNPEASGYLLAGHHGPEGRVPNAAALIGYGPRYTDDGEALGALIDSGAHELRGTDMTLANDAAHAVIQTSPEMIEHLGDKAKPALVTVLDDHIDNFEYVASERGSENLIDPPSNRITTLTYEEAFDYLKGLVGDDTTRDGATAVVGNQVADSIQIAVGSQDTSYANSAGALSEMGVLATAEADLDHAKTEQALNGFAKTATGKLVGFTPVGKNPVGDLVINQALDDIFSTDQVEKALEQQPVSQLQAHEAVKRLTIAAQVEMGYLPAESLEQINPNGTLNIDFVDGPGGDNDIVTRDGKPLEFDLDRDGKPETNITERELYDAGLGYSQAASEGISSLQHVHYDGTHTPDIDDLPLPDGLDNDNPNTVEKVLAWPFDAEGEGTISDGDHVVAEQDDLKWDADDQVYRLPVEIDGDKTELTYQRFDEGWKQVVWRNGQWHPLD
jgi:hypothetical protein